MHAAVHARTLRFRAKSIPMTLEMQYLLKMCLHRKYMPGKCILPHHIGVMKDLSVSHCRVKAISYFRLKCYESYELL